MAKTLLPDTHFGPVTDRPLDWRKLPPDNTPDDDELLPVTPRDTAAILGFDPMDFSNDGHITDSRLQRTRHARVQGKRPPARQVGSTRDENGHEHGRSDRFVSEGDEVAIGEPTNAEPLERARTLLTKHRKPTALRKK
jgi:hypothetical protein